MADKILVDYEVNVNSLQAQLKAVNAEFAKTEAIGVEAGNQTTESFDKTAKGAESLRTQLRKLQAELAEATDPKDIERLAKAAGNLRDKLEDATDAAKIFSSESKFEQVGNALGSIAGKIRNLDFKGASEQSKLLLSVVQSITFKEALTGLKDVGTTLLNIGKSLVTNPLFVLGATLAGIAKITYDVVNSFKDLEKESKTLSDAMQRSSESLLSYSDRVKQSNIKLQESLGIISKSQADALRSQITNNKERLDLQKKFSDDIVALAVSTNQDLSKSEKGYFSERYTGDIEDLNLKKKFNSERSKLEAIFQKDYAQLIKTQRVEQINATAADLEKEKTLIVEKKKEIVALVKKIKPDNSDAVIKDLLDTRPDDQAFVLAREKAYQENVLNFQEAENEIDEINKKSTELYKDELAQRAAADKAAAQQRKQDAINVAQAIGGLISQITELQNQEGENNLQEARVKNEDETKDLDRQLKARLISQEQYDKLVAQSNQKLKDEQNKIAKAQFEANKQNAIIQATINTAVGVTKAFEQSGIAGIALGALILAAGAAEIALISSQKAPKFAKGVVGLQGKGTETSDEIPAWLSVNESVITASGTKKHKGLLEAINKDLGIKYIEDVYIAPVLRQTVRIVAEQKEKDFAKNIANSFMLQQQFNDKNIVESLKKSRKNDQEIAYYLVKNLNPKVNKYNW